MRGAKSKESAVFFGVKLPRELRLRLRLESMRTGQRMRSLVADALDSYLPEKIEIVAHRGKAARVQASR